MNYVSIAPALLLSLGTSVARTRSTRLSRRPRPRSVQRAAQRWQQHRDEQLGE